MSNTFLSSLNLVAVEGVYSVTAEQMQQIEQHLNAKEAEIKDLENVVKTQEGFLNDAANKTEAAEAVSFPFEFKKKSYAFTKPKFKVLGDANTYVAETIAAEPQEHKDVIEKILKLEGQTIIVAQ